MNSLGLALPPKRITVNLSPADLLKEGGHFDLPIALGVLAVMGAIPADEVEGYYARVGRGAGPGFRRAARRHPRQRQ